MALSSSPRKVVPLATGDDWQTVPKNNGPPCTKRVFYCGVVVESSENGRRLPEGMPSIQQITMPASRLCHLDVQDLVASLGEPLDSGSDSGVTSSPTDAFFDIGPEQVSLAAVYYFDLPGSFSGSNATRSDQLDGDHLSLSSQGRLITVLISVLDGRGHDMHFSRPSPFAYLNFRTAVGIVP